MAVESATYVKDLNPLNPPGSDLFKEGDDHFRMFKTAVKQSFDRLQPKFTTGGTSTALTLTTGHFGATLEPNGFYSFILHTAIGAGATLNVDALGAKALLKPSSGGYVAVAANDYPLGARLVAAYSASTNSFHLVNAQHNLPFLPLVGGTLTGDLIISNSQPDLRLNETDAAANAKVWSWVMSAGTLLLRTLTDAGGAGQNILRFFRSGTTVTDVDISAGGAVRIAFDANGVNVPNGMIVGNPVGGFKGTGAINASQGFYDNNVKLSPNRFLKWAWASTGQTGATGAFIPWDDSVPQFSEGAEVGDLALAFTPLSGSSVLVIDVQLIVSFASVNSSSACILAVFEDNGPSALRAVWAGPGPTNEQTFILRTCFGVNSGGTGARTYRVRVGGSNMAVRWNGSAAGGGRKLGGSADSHLIIHEILP